MLLRHLLSSTVFSCLILLFPISIDSQDQRPFPSDQSKGINEWDRLFPTIVICILVRNKAQALPYFFGHLEDLDYPKNRISLFVRTDHNVDQSRIVLETWLKSVQHFYHKIDYKAGNDDVREYEGERGPFDWAVRERVETVAKLKQAALNFARDSWADYAFFVDCDVFLTERRVLQMLITARKTVISPLLRGPTNDEANFTNFEIDESKVDNTITTDFVFDRDQPGIWPVDSAHAAIFIDLTNVKSNLISFDLYHSSNGTEFNAGKWSDVDILAASLRNAHLQYHLDNRLLYGTIVPPMRQNLAELGFDVENIRFTVLESLNDGVPGLLYSPFVPPIYPTDSTLGLNEIFLINLKRRRDKLDRMYRCFEILGLNVTVIEAVDGNFLVENELKKYGVKPLASFRDPRAGRVITKGEIGCFLSHYHIWKAVVDGSKSVVAVFEDDVRFVRYFRSMLENLIEDLDSNADFEWDLIYLGRKILKQESDLNVSSFNIPKSIRYLAPVGYSYWTIGYLLSLNGAKKLLRNGPLSKLIPVDEYFPLMFDQHPDQSLKAHFPTRDLKAFTVSPLFIHPVRYTGQLGYISDTEYSTLIDQDSLVDPTQSDRPVDEL